MGEGALQFGDGGHLAGQVALELLVVSRDDLLDHRVVQLVLLVGDVVGHRGGVVGAARLVVVGLLAEHVGDAVQRGRLAERQLQRGEAAAEGDAELVEDGVEVGAVLVVLVDEDHPRQAALGGSPPEQFGLDLDALDGTDDDDRQVGDGQRGLHLADEVRVAGAVDQVDLVGLAVARRPLERGDRQRDGDAPGDLLRLGVERAAAVVDLAGAGGRAGSGQATPRPAWSCHCRCGPTGPRCGCSPSESSSRPLLC